MNDEHYQVFNSLVLCILTTIKCTNLSQDLRLYTLHCWLTVVPIKKHPCLLTECHHQLRANTYSGKHESIQVCHRFASISL